jgi:hypothetical protein
LQAQRVAPVFVEASEPGSDVVTACAIELDRRAILRPYLEVQALVPPCARVALDVFEQVRRDASTAPCGVCDERIQARCSRTAPVQDHDVARDLPAFDPHPDIGMAVREQVTEARGTQSVSGKTALE